MKRPIVHFEIGCSRLPETVDFYQKTFGWDISPHGNTAPIQTGGDQGIPGHINKLGPEDPQQYVTIYIETDDLEGDLGKIVAHGGKRRVDPITLPDGRRFAWFQDLEDNIVGLITAAKQ